MSQDYQRAGLITADEVAMIEHVENKTPEEVNTIMAEVGHVGWCVQGGRSLCLNTRCV